MPLYEYHCRDCKQDFELLVRGSESVSCPACSSPKLEKLLSVPAAPAGSNSELPVCRPQNFGGCGAPQCGMGECGM
jgi:putative FmdB family regulatory protein